MACEFRVLIVVSAWIWYAPRSKSIRAAQTRGVATRASGHLRPSLRITLDRSDQEDGPHKATQGLVKRRALRCKLASVATSVRALPACPLARPGARAARAPAFSVRAPEPHVRAHAAARPPERVAPACPSAHVGARARAARESAGARARARPRPPPPPGMPRASGRWLSCWPGPPVRSLTGASKT